MIARPTVGTKTTKIITVEICAHCGYINDGGLCVDNCDLDGDSHTGNIILAKYERTDTFLGDEAPLPTPRTLVARPRARGRAGKQNDA